LLEPYFAHQFIITTPKTLKHSSQLILDEAGQCIEPEALLPILNNPTSKIVLIGDYNHLKPYRSEDSPLQLEVSMFERLFSKASKMVKTMLTQQFRMHPNLSKVPSVLFYEDQITNGVGYFERNLDVRIPKIFPNENAPYSWINIDDNQQERQNDDFIKNGS